MQKHGATTAPQFDAGAGQMNYLGAHKPYGCVGIVCDIFFDQITQLCLT